MGVDGGCLRSLCKMGRRVKVGNIALRIAGIEREVGALNSPEAASISLPRLQHHHLNTQPAE